MADEREHPDAEPEDEFADPEATRLVSEPLLPALDPDEPRERTTEPDIAELRHAASGRPTLVVIHGASVGQRFLLDERAYVIGRADTCDVCLDDDTASRRHCQLTVGADGLHLVDLGSRNGSYVNDVSAATPLPVVDGDVLRVGRTLLKYLGGRNVEMEYFEEIHRVMTTDGLTGALNRRGLDAELERRWYEWRRYRRSFALVMVDLDHFKAVNDTHGHRVGDRVLADLGKIVLDMKRLSDAFGRYGGEEFVLVLPETPLDAAIVVAERLRVLVAEHPFEIEGGSFRVTVSLGVTTSRADVHDVASLVQEADARLYQAKQGGRDRVVPAPLPA